MIDFNTRKQVALQNLLDDTMKSRDQIVSSDDSNESKAFRIAQLLTSYNITKRTIQCATEGSVGANFTSKILKVN